MLGFFDLLKQLAHMEDPHDLVEVIFVDGKFGHAGLAGQIDHLVDRRVGLDGDDLGARDHYLADNRLRQKSMIAVSIWRSGSSITPSTSGPETI